MRARRLGRWGTVLAIALGVSVIACGKSPAGAPDAQATSTARIVTVGGAITETVFALGAGDDVVGVDTSSVFPESLSALPHVGYQRSLAAEGVLSLRPTLLLASSDAGPPEVLAQLRNAGVRVETITGEPSVAGARTRIGVIAQLLGRDAAPLLATFDRDLAEAEALVAKAKSRPRVLSVYARGANALHVLGRGSAGDALVTLAGGESAVTAFEGSKPMTAEAVVESRPDWILVPSRGLASIGGEDGLFRTPGVAETPAGKAKHVIAMDDLLLLGFGPRTGRAVVELTRRIHPELSAAP